MRIRHNHGRIAWIDRKEGVHRRPPPLDLRVERREELGTRLALDRNRDASLIELNQHERERGSSGCAHLRLIANRDEISLNPVGPERIWQLRCKIDENIDGLLDGGHLLQRLPLHRRQCARQGARRLNCLERLRAALDACVDRRDPWR